MSKGDFVKTTEFIYPLRGVVRGGALAALLDNLGAEHIPWDGAISNIAYSNGRVVSFDSDGATWSITYLGNGSVDKLTSTSGVQYVASYDGNNNIVSFA